ncbi:hypothetical protein BGX38DRAFT_449021 [Terfezia claveryi]|nr:hypothetical protein BGX38DRAFT_449021 [Terfezia claveryi]
MSLQKTYIRFLSTPKASTLSKDTVALHYITSGISVSGEAIISHLSNQHHVLEKKTEKVLSGFETMDSLVLEIETVVEFKSGGGAYLPGLDDNFLADQTATFLLIHVVNFQNGLINQIRQYWDQGTLLKQMGVIGKSGRNWPIKDGKDQCKLVHSSVANVPLSSGVSQTRDRGISNASNGSTTSSIRPTPDPHSTLSLFAPREQEQVAEIKPAVIPPRNSAKPPPRDLGDLFISSDGESIGNTTEEIIPPKAPAKFSRGQNYDFLDDDSHENPPDISGRGVKPDPKKYNHFEMSDEYPDSRPAARARDDSRNKASWDFESFSTPEKTNMRSRPDGARNFSLGDDNTKNKPLTGAQNNAGDRRDAAGHAKRDGSHFTIADVSPAPQRQHSKVDQLGGGSRTIYKTSGDGMGGRKVVENEQLPIEGHRAVSQAKMAKKEAEEEARSKRSEVVEQLGGGSRTIYRTQGDGMGGRKNAVEEEAPARAPRGISAAKRAEMGYEDEDINQGPRKVELLGGGSSTIYRTQGDGMGGRKVVAEEGPARAPRTISAAKRAEMTYEEEEPKNEVEQLAGGNRTIYRTLGDGMGGRKNAAEEEDTKRRAPRTMSVAKQMEMGYGDDEPDSNHLDQLGGGSRTIYRTQGDGMGGRKIVAEQASANAPRALSAAKRAEMTHDEEEPSGKVELLGGGSRTIYKTTGDGMGGRKGASSSIFGFDEEEPVEKNKENQRQRPGVRKDNQPSSFWDF